MISTRKRVCEELGLIYCDECGYCNRKEMIDKYGTCKRCRKVLDDKAKFNYEMNMRLRLWRKDKNRR